jgi:proteasome lid subunit RPN8/RPN11
MTQSIFRQRYRVTTAERIARTDPLWMTPEVIAEIRGTIGSLPAETGGMLGLDRGSGVISRFVFDASATTSSVTYSPDIEFVNRVLKEWNAAGVRLAGFVHSHPAGVGRPSAGDMSYVERALWAMPDLDEFALPIVQPQRSDGEEWMVGFAVHRDEEGNPILRRRPVRPGPVWSPNPDHYVRVSADTYDLELLQRARIVVVGAGGSASFCEDLARVGVGQFVLIDPDVIEASNIATQKVRVSEIGTHKARELARSITSASQHARVLAVRSPVEQCVADFERLLFGSLPGVPAGPPEVTLLCGFTDDFYAQAFVNRVALQFDVPMLAAQLYERGAGLELTFSNSATTVACGRCVLGGRYRAFGAGAVNDVGSAGTPYAATAHLNALKQDLAIALLLGSRSERIDDTRKDSSHPARLAARQFLARIGNRNLIQVRRDPDIARSLGLLVFDRVLGVADRTRLLCGDAVWLPQQPEAIKFGFEPCPDCGGVGDLSRVAGTFDDLGRLDWSLSRDRAMTLEVRHQVRREFAHR